MKKLPYLAVGHNELADKPPLGKTVKCWLCGKRHRVSYGEKVNEDGSREPSRTLAFFKCRGQAYLCGINGKEWRPDGE